MVQKIYFVGTHAEVAHHAAPIEEIMPLEIVSASEVVEKAKRGDLAVFFSEHFDRFRDCVIQLKSKNVATLYMICLLYTSPSPRDRQKSRMPSSA